LSTPDYLAYHDDEWGRPVRGDAALYERITLEAFQSGLSWLTILRKRPAFRAAFAGFTPEAVAAYGPVDVARLLGDAGIVRNRAKIEAAVANAAAVVALGAGGLTDLLWSFAPPVTPASTALATALKSAGFRFVGPTTAYAAMQACGLVDDHLAGCAARGAPGGRSSNTVTAPARHLG
jgi:DNA-3-methyladenine glycosylase I